MDKHTTLKIVKIGGNVIDDAQALVLFSNIYSHQSQRALKFWCMAAGNRPPPWHIKLGWRLQMIDGRRITDAATLELITMVYAGKINKTIVAQLQAFDCNALGFTGADGNTITSRKNVQFQSVDYGFVGDVKNVETSTLELLLEHGEFLQCFVPSLMIKKGQLLNTNADTIASELAIAFASHFEVELYYCFEKKGCFKRRE